MDVDRSKFWRGEDRFRQDAAVRHNDADVGAQLTQRGDDIVGPGARRLKYRNVFRGGELFGGRRSDDMTAPDGLVRAAHDANNLRVRAKPLEIWERDLRRAEEQDL